jgi:hypothetical protein
MTRESETPVTETPDRPRPARRTWKNHGYPAKMHLFHERAGWTDATIEVRGGKLYVTPDGVTYPVRGVSPGALLLGYVHPDAQADVDARRAEEAAQEAARTAAKEAKDRARRDAERAANEAHFAEVDARKAADASSGPVRDGHQIWVLLVAALVAPELEVSLHCPHTSWAPTDGTEPPLCRQGLDGDYLHNGTVQDTCALVDEYGSDPLGDAEAIDGPDRPITGPIDVEYQYDPGEGLALRLVLP